MADPVRASDGGSRWTSPSALGVAALAMAAVLLRGPRRGAGPSLLLLVVAFAALAVVVGSERRRRRLDRRLVLGVSGALLVLAVVVPPTESADVWSYAMYGRMVAQYHASPYRHTAAEYKSDPIARRVPAFWVRSRSVYGPLFTGVSAGGMAVADRSPVAARLFFQGLAALAVAAALLLVDRRTRDPVALVVLGVNPITVVSVVNGGHNDALVGLAVLGGVLLVGARKPGWAGAALAAGALVKVGALLPLAAVAVWVWFHHGRRAATVLAAAAAGVGVAGLVAAGAPDVLGALGDAQGRVKGGSVWAGPTHWLAGGGADAAALERVGRGLAWAGTAAAAALTVLLAARRPRREGVVVAAGASVVAYLLVGTYVLPWYLAWGLPVLALAWRWRVVWLAIAQAAVLQLATARVPPGGSGVSRFQDHLYRWEAPMLEVALVAVVVVAMVRRLRRAPPDDARPADDTVAAGDPLPSAT